MLTFLAKRIVQLIPTLFFVSVLIFSLQHLLPGDPALIMAGEDRDPDVIEQIRKQYHLDQPIPVQYFYWVKGALSGNLNRHEITMHDRVRSIYGPVLSWEDQLNADDRRPGLVDHRAGQRSRRPSLEGDRDQRHAHHRSILRVRFRGEDGAGSDHERGRGHGRGEGLADDAHRSLLVPCDDVHDI